MTALLHFALDFVFVCIVLAMLCCALRMLLGPTAHDRVLAQDTLWMTSMLLVRVLGIRFGNEIYFEAAVVIVLIGFVSTVALAKFLMRGEVIE